MNRLSKLLIIWFTMGLSLIAAMHAKSQNSDTLIVLKSGQPVVVDGIISPGEWADSDSLFIKIDTNWISKVYFKHDSSHILLAFKNLEQVIGRAHVVDLFIDKLNDRSADWNLNDLWLHASYNDCEALGQYYYWTSCSRTKPDWLANNLPFSDGNDNIEMQINFEKFDMQDFPDTLGFCISVNQSADHYWPGSADLTKPSTWGYLVIPQADNSGVQSNKMNGKFRPKESMLFQNYPNPFNPSTIIRFSLAKSSEVNLAVYNLLGQKIRTIFSGLGKLGEYTFVWDAKDDYNQHVSSGIYYYQFKTETGTYQNKMVYIR